MNTNIIKCLYCKIEFTRPQAWIRTKNQFCSREHYYQFQREFNPLIICKNCKKQFRYNPHGTKKFCCHRCSSEYQKKPLTTLICFVCKKSFLRKVRKNAERRYCSRYCKGVDYSTRRVGKNNPAFGIKRPDTIIRNKTEKMRKAVSQANQNKPKSEETKRKISVSKKGKKINRIKGNPNKGKTWEEMFGIDGAKQKREQLLNYIKNTPRFNTSIEKKIEKELLKNNIQYLSQKPISIKGKEGWLTISDFFIKPNIVIFCDGDYWHSLPRQKERDNYVNLKLNENHFITLRFSEKEINNNIERCTQKILNHVEIY